MFNSDRALKEQRRSIAEAARGPQSQVFLNLMVFFGMMIGGIVERSCYPNAISEDSDVFGIALTASNSSTVVYENRTWSRRYCDPPNRTVHLHDDDYNDADKEENSQMDNDFPETEKIDFTIQLTKAQKDAHHEWLVFLLGSASSSIIISAASIKISPGRLFGFFVLATGLSGVLLPDDWMPIQFAASALQGFLQGSLLPGALLIATSSKDTNREIYIGCLSGSRLGFGIAELVPQQQRRFATFIPAIIWFITWLLIVRFQKIVVKKKIPWRKIVSSKLSWMSAVVLFGTELLFYTTVYTFRQYLDYIYYYSNRVVYFIPEAGSVLCSLASSLLVQHLLNRGIMPKSLSRELFIYISHYLPSGILFVMACLAGCSEFAPVLMFGVAIVAEGCAFAGAYCTVLDVSTTYAPAIVSFCCTWGAIGRLLAPLLTLMIFAGKMPGSWKFVLSVSALIGVTTAASYILWTSTLPPPKNLSEISNHIKLTSSAELNKRLLRVKNRTRTWSTSLPLTTKDPEVKRASIS